MRLGSRILRNIFHKPNKRRNRSTLDNVVGVAVGIAAVTAVRKLQQESGGTGAIIPEIINHAMDLKAQDAAKPKTDSGATLATEKRFNTLMAKLAVCYYIAGIDGEISPNEERAITQRIKNIRDTGDIPEKYRDALAELEGYRPMTFDEVKVYLDRADSKALVSLTLRAEYIAKMDGMTAAEKSAIDGIKLYVEGKVGYHFKDLHTMPLTVSMICPTCGGRLVPDASLRKATCDYCGFTKLVEMK